MTAGVRSRRAGGISPEEARNRPLYARVLGLQYVRPSNLMCFLFFEGTVALAVLLSLAELTGWWAVAVLPASVAAMVKVNDVIAGATTRSGVASVSRPQRPDRTRRALTQPTMRLREAVPGAVAGSQSSRAPAQPDHVERQPSLGVARAAHAEPGPSGYDDEEQTGPAAREPWRSSTQPDLAGDERWHGSAAQAGPVTPAAEEPWLGSAKQRAASRRHTATSDAQPGNP